MIRSGALQSDRGGTRHGWRAGRRLTLKALLLRMSTRDEVRCCHPRIDWTPEQVQVVAAINHGISLNEGQEDAAGLVLSSRDGIVAIQGIAGAGKSSVVKPVAGAPRGRQAGAGARGAEHARPDARATPASVR